MAGNPADFLTCPPRDPTSSTLAFKQVLTIVLAIVEMLLAKTELQDNLSKFASSTATLKRSRRILAVATVVAIAARAAEGMLLLCGSGGVARSCKLIQRF
jgi:hypothetical protein